MNERALKRAASRAEYVKLFFDALKEKMPQCSDDALLNSATQLVASWDICMSMPNDVDTSELRSISTGVHNIADAIENGGAV